MLIIYVRTYVHMSQCYIVQFSLHQLKEQICFFSQNYVLQWVRVSVVEGQDTWGAWDGEDHHRAVRLQAPRGDLGQGEHSGWKEKGEESRMGDGHQWSQTRLVGSITYVGVHNRQCLLYYYRTLQIQSCGFGIHSTYVRTSVVEVHTLWNYVPTYVHARTYTYVCAYIERIASC